MLLFITKGIRGIKVSGEVRLTCSPDQKQER